MSLITANQIAARFAAIEARLDQLEARDSRGELAMQFTGDRMRRAKPEPLDIIDDQPTKTTKPAKRKRR